MQGEEEDSFVANEKSQLHRLKARGSYDVAAVRDLLSRGHLAHVGLMRRTQDGEAYPVVLPMLYGVDAKCSAIFLHGSSAMGMTQSLGPICVTVSLLHAWVIAKSLFHHSANYEVLLVQSRGLVQFV